MPDTSTVTRYELDAHLRRLDEGFEDLERRIDTGFSDVDEKLSLIQNRLDARPAQRWLAGRVTGIVDRTLPTGIAGLVAGIAAYLFS